MKAFNSLDRRQFNIFMLKIASFLNFGNLLFFWKNARADEQFHSKSIGTGSNGKIENAKQWQDTENAFYDGKDGQNYGNDRLHAAVAAAADSAAAHGHGRVGITAISVDGGGDMPGSYTHENGTCYDVRYLGNDGDAHDIDDPTYSREGTEDFIREAHEQQHIVQVVTGDSILAASLNNSGINAVQDTSNNHDNHVHIQFANPNDGDGEDENNEEDENDGGG